MAPPEKREIARVLRELGLLLQIKGDNPFKTRAYEMAAERLESLATEEFEERLRSGSLVELPGIGDAIAKKIATLRETGSLPLHEQLRAEFPPGLLELTRVPDLGPRKIATLWRELLIGSVDDLARACREGRVRGLRGFGERIETRLLEGIAALHRLGARRPFADAYPVALELAERLGQAPGVTRVEAGGSLRRMCETVGDLDLVVAAPEARPVFDDLLASPAVGRVLGRGDTKCSVALRDGLQVDVRVVPPEAYPTALHHFTGSKAHHIRLRGLARDRGLTLSEWGLERLDGSGRLAVESEPALYQSLGLPFIPPELREDTGEIEAALEGRLPTLVSLEQVRGLVHVHSDFSDGKASILELARAARSLGMAYLAITDHSRSAGYAGGLDEERLRTQWDEIAAAQEQVPEVRLLRGAEVDILEDGRLDYPEEVLEQLEVVVASVHSRFQLDEDAMTRRLLTALENPFTQVLGHPTGRLIGKREAYEVRLGEVLDAAARHGVAVEVNGNPERLDLGAEHVREAVRRGVKLVVTPDAHSVAGLQHLRFSVGTARRGWATSAQVLNCLGAEDFLAALR